MLSDFHRLTHVSLSKIVAATIPRSPGIMEAIRGTSREKPATGSET
jgi:hypothetical protein